MNFLQRFIFWPVFFITHLLTTALFTWHILAQVNFEYPVGYRIIGIDKHIQEFAPRNNFKHNFQFTSPQEHWDLFAQITQAVQHDGKGLAEISYKLPNGSLTPLMHKAEIIHLQDVANLISTFYKIGIASALIWIGLVVIAFRKEYNLPAVKHILLGFLIGTLTVITFIISFGATKIFYWVHTKIFPDGHQWFFYYEDSLMTTMMKAPDIFAFIACLLVMLLITLWVLSMWGMNKLLKAKKLLKPRAIKNKQQKPKKERHKAHCHPKLSSSNAYLLLDHAAGKTCATTTQWRRVIRMIIATTVKH